MSGRRPGRPPGSVRYAPIASRVHPDVYDSVCRIALRRGISVSELVRLVLTHGIQVLKNPPPSDRAAP